MNIEKQNIADTLETNYMPYAMSVIVSRAIPEIDGFKPAHRKLLYTMYKMGLLTGNRMKSADVVGATMRLNPHGDQAIYETLVRMTRGHAALLHPFIDSKGNFGKSYSRDMAYAASRYTEVRLDAVCGEIFRDIDKNTVDFVDNYNGQLKEPRLLPTAFPNVLVSSNQGIAVGMASSVCGFNLREVCEAAVSLIKNPGADLAKIIEAPDFSTGGEIIYDGAAMAQIFETGRGAVKLRAKWGYDKKNSCVEITEIPYTTTIEAVIDKIAALCKAGKLRDITDVRDETDLGGLKIAVDIRKSADPASIMKKLFAATPLMDGYACNFNILVDGRPRTMGVKEILSEWLRFRKDCVTRRLKFDLGKAEERLHMLDGLAEILLDIDRAIRIIRDTEKDADVVPNLAAGFNIDDAQAEYAAEIKLRNLNKQHLLKQIESREQLEAEVEGLKAAIGDERRILKIIEVELKEISKKYGKPRTTAVVYDTDETSAEPEDLIDDYNVRLFLTAHSYFKKIPLTSLRSAGEQYLKDDDVIVQELEAANKDDLLFFSNFRNVYKMKAYEFADSKAGSIGEYLANALKCEDGERIVFIAATRDYSGLLVIGYENGKFAKIPLNLYETKTNRKKLVAGYSDKAEPVFFGHSAGERDLFAVRAADKATLLNTALIPLSGAKNAVGVLALTLKKGSKMTAVIPLEKAGTVDAEYYRAEDIPTAAHFLMEADRQWLTPGTPTHLSL
jgi:DNA gyrase subunit A